MSWLKFLRKKKKEVRCPVYCKDCKHRGEKAGDRVLITEAINSNRRYCNFYSDKRIDYSSGEVIFIGIFCYAYNEDGDCKAFERANYPDAHYKFSHYN